MKRREHYFATCAPGLEPLLHEEAKQLGLMRIERQVGGILFEGSVEDVWRANLGLRTAVRIFLRLARYEAKNSDELYRGAFEVDWTRFLKPEGTLIVDSQTRESELFHTHFIQQRVKDGVVDQFRERFGVRPSVSVDEPDLRIHVHLFRDRATLSVDTSGGSLHKRGWRAYQGRAPLAETLAAAIVLLSDWDRRSPLLDPFCGSGSIAIEAAALAAGVAPGSWRRFGFENWPGHDAAGMAALRKQLSQQVHWPKKLRILGFDSDPEQIEGARENAASAGFESRLEFELGDACQFAPRAGWNGWIVTNPPYGLRVGDVPELERVYRQFGSRLRENCQGYQLALLSGNRDLSTLLELSKPRKTELLNGGIDCMLLESRLGGEYLEPRENPRKERRKRRRQPFKRGKVGGGQGGEGRRTHGGQTSGDSNAAQS